MMHSKTVICPNIELTVNYHSAQNIRFIVYSAQSEILGLLFKISDLWV